MRTGGGCCCCCCCCCSCCLCRCLGLLSAKLLRLLQLRCSPSVNSFFHSQNVVLKNTGCNCAALRPPLAPFPTHRLLALLLTLLLALLLALLLRLRQQWRGWPLGEPACTCRRCCVKPLAERRWQSTHGRQALKKTAVPEPARELPLAKQARALRRPHAAGCPGRCAIAPAGWMANLWRGARGRGGTARHSTWSTSRGGSGKEILNARSSGTLP